MAADHKTAMPPFRLSHCPDYWRDPHWSKPCRGCGRTPDYMVEEMASAEFRNGRRGMAMEQVPYCAWCVPLEYEAQRAWAIARARRAREYFEGNLNLWTRRGNRPATGESNLWAAPEQDHEDIAP